MLKRFFPRGLFARTLLILILPIFILQALGLYLFYERHWDKLAQRLSASVAGDVGLIVEWYEADPTWLDAAQRVRLKRYIDLDARAYADEIVTGSPARYGYLKQALRGVLDDRDFTLRNPGGENITTVVDTKVGKVAIEIPKRRLYSSTTKIFALWMVGSTILMALIAALYIRRQIRPIIRLATTAWGQGRAGGALKLEGAEEVRQATAAFLDMQERINRQQEQRQAIMTGVREDLQKPIDRIKMTLGSVLKGHPDAPAMAADVREMERMIDGYLAYMRDNRDEPLQVVTLKSLLDEAVRLSGVKHLPIERRGVDSVMLKARPLAITRAFANIIRKAGTLDATMMMVDARMISTDDGSVLLLCFEDNGRGMEAAEMTRALRPLEQTGKTGRDYGLAIAADMVDSQGGSFELARGVKGLRVSIVLPV